MFDLISFGNSFSYTKGVSKKRGKYKGDEDELIVKGSQFEQLFTCCFPIMTLKEKIPKMRIPKNFSWVNIFSPSTEMKRLNQAAQFLKKNFSCVPTGEFTCLARTWQEKFADSNWNNLVYMESLVRNIESTLFEDNGNSSYNEKFVYKFYNDKRRSKTASRKKNSAEIIDLNAHANLWERLDNAKQKVAQYLYCIGYRSSDIALLEEMVITQKHSGDEDRSSQITIGPRSKILNSASGRQVSQKSLRTRMEDLESFDPYFKTEKTWIK